MFDKLLLLSRGRTVFFGPRQAAPRYFEETGHPIPALYNPADFILHLTNVDFFENREAALKVCHNDMLCGRMHVLVNPVYMSIYLCYFSSPYARPYLFLRYMRLVAW